MRTAIIALLLPIAASAFFFGNSCGCQQRCPAPACPLPAAPVCPPPPVCGGGGYATAPQQFAAGPAYRPAPQQVQPQFVQQSYAQPQQAQAAEFGDEALAAQSENHEYGQSNGQSATLEETAEPQQESTVSEVASDAAAPVEEAAETVDVNEAQPQETATAAANTVYDDIVNAAQAATATEEYSAAAAAASRRRYHSVRRAPAAAFDPKCNSESLKALIQQNIGDSTSSSKRSIQKAASEEIGGHIDVICSTGTFSYIVNTELYCETEKDGITCFAFRQSN
ncbi:grl-5 [Pristionchus pacificus]|nr:grl-5 [Pristionchus pacificus]